MRKKIGQEVINAYNEYAERVSSAGRTPVDFKTWYKVRCQRAAIKKERRKPYFTHWAANILCVLGVLFALWFVLSWADIVVDNTEPNPVHHKYNLFVLMTESMDDTAEPDYTGSCGDPLTLRQTTAEIVRINDNIITFMDADGEEWIAEVGNPAEFDPAGYYIIMFDDMGTADLYDDEILKVFREVW